MKRWIVFLGTLLVMGAIATCTILGAGKQPKENELDVQYAQTLLQLEQSLCQRALSINQRTPGEISPQQIQVLLQQRNVGQQIAEQARKTGKLPWFTIMLACAEADECEAQHAWAVAARAHQTNSDTTSAADLEVLRLRAELAHLNLLRGRRLVTASLEEQQNWGLTALLMEFQHHRATTTSVGP